jgi:RimJ/RimL family protein N-acetyltransferase
VEKESVQLRPVRGDDLWLFERKAVDPDAGGAFNWTGYKDLAGVRRQYERDGLIGPDGGRLIVANDDIVMGDAAWSKVTYGIPAWWCWSIGISLLPEFRRQGFGTRAQLLLVGYLFDTTSAERVQAYTDVENIAEQRSLERVGFAKEGTIRSVQFRSGQWCDVFIYGMLRADFYRLSPVGRE